VRRLSSEFRADQEALTLSRSYCCAIGQRTDLKTQTQFAHRTPGTKVRPPPFLFPFLFPSFPLICPPQQPPGLWEITKSTYARQGILGFYSGVGALVAGNSLKAGVRFLSYDSFKGMLVDEQVRFFFLS
jgi:solute carrier family 25 citrate transporter 1